MRGDKLTTKQKLFVEYYLANPNGVEAARKAGYKGSDAQLAVIASQNLRKLNVAVKVEERIEEAGMTADEVLNELAAIAKGDYKLYRGDKVKSLELLGKYRKLFTDRTEVKFNVSDLTDEELDALISSKG